MPLRVIFRRALDDGVVVVNPCERLPLPSVEGRRERIAPPEEAAQLLAALPLRDRALYGTAFFAGLRMGELRALRWEHVDLAAGLVLEGAMDERGTLIAPKSRAGRRRVPIVAARAAHRVPRGGGRRGLRLRLIARAPVLAERRLPPRADRLAACRARPDRPP